MAAEIVKPAMPDQLKTQAALEYLGLSSCYYAALNGLECERRTPAQFAVGGAVSMYRTADLDRVRALMREARLSAHAAVRVVIAQNEGRI
jgi:hypothetical protein